MAITLDIDADGILAETDLQFRELADVVPAMIWMLGPGMASTFFFNKCWREFVGPEQCDGWWQSVHPDDHEHCTQIFANAFARREKFVMEYRRRRVDGECRWLLDTAAPRFAPDGSFLGYVGCANDVTERRNLQTEQLYQRNELTHLARVATLGELSGSLAHELTQPLTAILSNAQAAQGFLADGRSGMEEMRAILDDIVSEDRRAGEVIRRLRTLFRKGEVQRETINLNELATDVLKLMNSQLVNHDVRVHTELAADLPLVDADRVQMQQVLINLVLNAIDAMADTPMTDRLLTVSTMVRSDNDVEMRVSDTGCGIPLGQSERLFEPFHTTKSQGIGLGLAVCRTIVAAHSGRLWAGNNPGGGACFHMTLASIRTGVLQ